MRLTLFLFSMLLSGISFAQEGYKIDFKIKGLKDTTVYLGFYLQEKHFVKDTAIINSHGAFSFKGAKTAPQGIYMIILGKNNLFDFVMGPDQYFSIETSTEDYLKSMVVKGDDDNRLFFENSKYLMQREKEVDPFVKIIKDSTLKEEQKKSASESLTKLNEKAITWQQSILDQYPGTITARLLKMNKPIDVPEPPKKANGNIDSTFQLRYYRQHYFDNFDLGDEAMLRMPKVFYESKVKDYLDKLFIQHPDTITREIEKLVSIAKRNKETYKFMVWKLAVNYQNPPIMGLDEVFVNLYDKYYATGEMDYWLDKKTVQNLKNYADKLRHAMIGRTAPNLMMQDEKLQPKSLYDLTNRYSILFFFKPSCGHCREEAPKLVEFYTANKKKFDLGVFAVSTDTSMQEMKDFTRDMKTPWTTVNGPRSYIKTHFTELYFAETTPTIYIIDNNKKIIARKLAVDQLEDFLKNYELMLSRKKPSDFVIEKVR